MSVLSSLVDYYRNQILQAQATVVGDPEALDAAAEEYQRAADSLHDQSLQLATARNDAVPHRWRGGAAEQFNGATEQVLTEAKTAEFGLIRNKEALVFAAEAV